MHSHALKAHRTNFWSLMHVFNDLCEPREIWMLSIIDEADRTILAARPCEFRSDEQCARVLTRLMLQNGRPSKVLLEDMGLATAVMRSWCIANRIEFAYPPACRVSADCKDHISRPRAEKRYH